MPEVTIEDFARSFGTTVDDIPVDCKKLIDTIDFRYEIVTGEERDKVILDVLRKLETDKQVIGEKERQIIWEKGWLENLQEFIENNYDLKKITPKFIRPNQLIRFNQKYIMPANPNFELDYFSVFRLWLFRKYLKDFNPIYDFGCGTGFNLVALAQMYPDKILHGLDFVPSSCDIVNKIGEVYKWKMKGHLFDMTSPDENFKIERGGAILTSGSIEQLSGRFEAFLQFLLKQSPAMCVHIEPIVELYNENNLVDYLAIKFQSKRGYTRNFLPYLKELEGKGHVEIVKVKRLYFGSLFMEGYNLIVWRTVK